MRARLSSLCLTALVVPLALACSPEGDAKSTTAIVGDCTPSGDEVCDGIDNDCDGSVDEDVATVFYADADDDGYGGATTIEACELPAGFVTNGDDCDDLDPAVNPGATEVCDDADNDCDGAVDSDDDDVDLATASTWYIDEDGDGYGVPGDELEACSAPAGRADNADDCDDTDPALHPETVWYPDSDADGFGRDSDATVGCAQPDDHVLDGGDCDDTAPAVNPGADERCDGIDNDCNGTVDEDSAIDTTTFYADDDGDGYGRDDATTAACAAPTGYAALAGDCDDAEPAAHPDATEVCDGIDNDCDGAADLDAAVPADHATIQAAIDALPDGAGVCVASGTHSEALLFGSSAITIAGQADGSTVLDAGGDVALTAVSGGEVVLQDFVVDNAGGTRGAVARAQGGRLVLRDVTVTHADVAATTTNGIVTMDQGELVLERVTVDAPVVAAGTGGLDGALVYATDTTVSLTDVVVDGATFTSTGAIEGLVTVVDGELDIDGLTLRDATLTAYSNVYGALLLVENSDVVASRLSATGNAIEATAIDLPTGYLIRVDGGTGVDTLALDRVEIDDNTLLAADDAWAAIYASGIEAGTVDNLTFTRNTVQVGDDGYGLLFVTGGVLALTNADISSNTWDGFDRLYSYGGYASYQGEVAFVNVNLVDNITDTTPLSSAFYSSRSNASGLAGFSMDHTNVHGNTTAETTWVDGPDNPGDTSVFSGNVSVDPLYSDAAAGDFSLSATSPVIDLGDPTIFDADGSTSDIGAHGGPLGASW